MLRYLNTIHKASLLLIAFVVLMASCKKQEVDFGQESLTDDPNTEVIDTLTVSLSTFQIDSFPTAASNIFNVGIHTDPQFGKYESKAYMQIGMPNTNPINGCTNCSFDSVVFLTRYTGAFYGDTTEAFTLKVHRMNQRIVPDVTYIGYNVDTLGYDTASLATMVLNNTRPSQNTQLSIKMDDAFGMQIFNMLKRNSDTITDPTLFNKFFNGIVLTGKGANNSSMYYFTTPTTTSTTVMKIYYTQHTTAPVQYSIDFAYNPTTYQFNGYSYDKTGTNLSAFVPNKRQIIPTSQTGNNAYLHGNSGLYPYMSIPYLFSIKELHPYVKIIKAELQITPSLVNYGPNTFYYLPPSLQLYTISDDKLIGSPILVPGTTSNQIQSGNLVLDNQNHVNTKYTYDLTTFVNTILKAGIFQQQSLVLLPGANTVENRLILENAISNKAVKLKLYVLGL